MKLFSFDFFCFVHVFFTAAAIHTIYSHPLDAPRSRMKNVSENDAPKKRQNRNDMVALCDLQVTLTCFRFRCRYCGQWPVAGTVGNGRNENFGFVIFVVESIPFYSHRIFRYFVMLYVPFCLVLFGAQFTNTIMWANVWFMQNVL